MNNRHYLKTSCLVAMLSAFAGMPAAAVSLTEAYQAAVAYDADFLAAKAANEEVREGVPVAWAPLLPQLNYLWQQNRANTSVSYDDPTRFQRDQDYGYYDSGSSVWNFRQALFRKPAWDAVDVAKFQARAADATFVKEDQKTGLRAASSYLEVLAARASVTLAQNHTKSMEAWLALAEESFKAGRGTRTDIEDARSRLDMSRAKVTEAMMNLSVATRNFQVVTGMAAESIPDLDPRRLDPHRMVIKNSEDWLQRITENNPDIQSLRMQLKAARSYVAQMRSGHLPTVDFVATHRKSDSEYDTSIGQDYTTKYVGLQVTVPILSGGGVLALTRQAEAKEEKIHQSLVSTRRKVLSEAGRLYQACSQGSQLVQALNQAVISSEQAVVGEKKGVQAGTRTFVDALDAERRMYESMRDQAIAAYSLANNRLMFLALAAAIDLEAIETVSAWLSTASR